MNDTQHDQLSRSALPMAQVSVETYGRLHLGFFDLSTSTENSQGRRFGSLGVSVDGFKTRLSATISTINMPIGSVSNPSWVTEVLSQLLAAKSMSLPMTLKVIESIPRHAGLGSGTQMALALGTAIQTLQGETLNLAEIAHICGRGGRSGIGIATFAHGGIVVDGGKGVKSSLPPVLAQYTFPEEWRFLLILDDAHMGIHGKTEKSAFQQLLPQSILETQKLAYQLLMQGLPALIEQDFVTFASVLGALQSYNAAYFSPAQNGSYASQSVAQVLNFLKAQGHQGVGQTSWGPTGFVLLPSPNIAQTLQLELSQRFASLGLRYQVVKAVNHGARISKNDLQI